MITTPTDQLYKFAAIGGLVLAFAGGAGALRMYHETGIQQAEFIGAVGKMDAVYNRFAPLAREQIARGEKLKSNALTPRERAAIEVESQKFREMIPTFDKEFEEAMSLARRQEAITRHFRQMQAIWLVLAGAAIGIGAFFSYRGFKVWRSLPPNER